MKSSDLLPERSLDSFRQRREFLDVRNELETTRRKLLKTENALESLTSFLSAVPDPIEIVSENLSILFANETSKRIHDNQYLEGTPYHRIVKLGYSPDDSPVTAAIREKRDVVFSSVYQNGDVYETTVSPTNLSDGRRAALCLSRPVVLASAVPKDNPRDGDAPVTRSSVVSTGIDETGLLRRIATLSTRTLDAILDQISDGVVVANDRGGVVLVNHAFCHITRYGPNDNIPLAQVLFPDHEVTGSFGEFFARTEIKRFETTIINSDGARIPVEMTAAGIQEDTENPAGVLITIKDLRDTSETDSQTTSFRK